MDGRQHKKHRVMSFFKKIFKKNRAPPASEPVSSTQQDTHRDHHHADDDTCSSGPTTAQGGDIEERPALKNKALASEETKDTSTGGQVPQQHNPGTPTPETVMYMSRADRRKERLSLMGKGKGRRGHHDLSSEHTDPTCVGKSDQFDQTKTDVGCLCVCHDSGEGGSE